MELGGDTLGLQSLQPPLHRPPACNAVTGSHAGVCGRVALCVLAVARVLHDDRTGLGQVPAAERFRAVAAQVCRHPASGRAAPEGVTGGIYLQLIRVFKDELDGPCQVLTGGLRTGTVDQGKGVVAHLGQLQSVGEAIVHGPHIDKTAASIANGESLTRGSLEEKHPRVLLGGINGFFFLGINIIEDRVPGLCMEVHRIYNLHGLVRVDMAVPSQPQVTQGVPTVIAAIRWKDQPAIAAKDGITHHIGYGRVGSIEGVPILRRKIRCQRLRPCGSGHLRSAAAGAQKQCGYGR